MHLARSCHVKKAKSCHLCISLKVTYSVINKQCPYSSFKLQGKLAMCSGHICSISFLSTGGKVFFKKYYCGDEQLLSVWHVRVKLYVASGQTAIFIFT